MDKTDLIILKILQENARTSNAEIARQVGLAPSAIHERIKKLEEKGLIQHYRAIVDRKSLGYKMLAYVFIRSEEGAFRVEVAKQIAEFPEVLEIHNIAGEDCYLAKVIAEDPASLASKMRDNFAKLNERIRTRTTIVLETIKEDRVIPIKVPEQSTNK
jgi:Lrp/AsnC family leucine-responsive transcriptional regulator